MWDVLQKETAVQKGKTALRVDVANAVRRLWKVDADGRLPAWAPGTTDPLGTCLSEDVELRQLMEGVAEAGSWAVWMGVSVDPSVVGRHWSPVSSNKARGYCCRTPGDH
jgi:hypothetical protein